MHRNPVKRGLVEQPEQWKWSSFRAYFYGELGLVRVNFPEWPVEIKARRVQNFTGDSVAVGQPPSSPLVRKTSRVNGGGQECPP